MSSRSVPLDLSTLRMHVVASRLLSRVTTTVDVRSGALFSQVVACQSPRAGLAEAQTPSAADRVARKKRDCTSSSCVQPLVFSSQRYTSHRHPVFLILKSLKWRCPICRCSLKFYRATVWNRSQTGPKMANPGVFRGLQSFDRMPSPDLLVNNTSVQHFLEES